MTTTHRRTQDEHPLESAVEAFAALPPAPLDPEHPLAKLGIRHDGLRYVYNGYRYDQLADAVAYATLVRARAQPDPGGPFAQQGSFVAPTDAQRALMASLAIEFDGRAYRFQGYRYDALSDAVDYAKLVLGRQLT
jgi:hypothetical protein